MKTSLLPGFLVLTFVASACTTDSGPAASTGTGGLIGAGSGGALPGSGGTPIAVTGGTASSGGGPGNGGAAATSGGVGNGGATGGAPSTGGALTTGGVDAGLGDDAGSGGAHQGHDAGIDSGDAPVSYNPCPPKGTPCRILPLGDSITWGQGSSTGGGYRVPLFRLARAAGKSLTFVGPMTSGPAEVDGVPFPQANGGYQGITIAGLWLFSNGWVRSYKPHIVTLMIGTNDVTAGTSGGAPAALGTFMDQILAEDPTVLLVVASIAPRGEDALNVTTRTYNDGIPAVVAARSRAGKHVAFVDVYGALASNPSFKTEYLNDPVHPNDAGYAKMAEAWYRAVGPVLR